MRYTLLLLILLVGAGCSNNLRTMRKKLDLAQEKAIIVRAKLNETAAKLPREHPARTPLDQAREANEAGIGALKTVSKGMTGVQDKPDTLARLTSLAGYVLAGIVLLVLIYLYFRFRRSIAGTALSMFTTGVGKMPEHLHPVARKAIEKKHWPDR